MKTSCKNLIRDALKKAPQKALDVDTLRDSVVKSLVEAGKSRKKAAKIFAEKLALPIFRQEGSTVKLAKSNATPEPEAKASSKRKGGEEAAPSAKKPKGTDPPPAGLAASPVLMMAPAAAAKFCEQHRIEMTGVGAAAFRPVASFADAGFSPAVLRACAAFDKPTPIQAACWPVIMARRDVVGVAETGSGKTLAFFLPAMMHCASPPPHGASGEARVLVLAPTRELAMQSDAVCRDAGAHMGLTSVCIYGGVPKGPQRGALRAGVKVLVATPGRLLDLVNEGACVLHGTTYLVLDEADRMLDMGFEKDVRAIIAMTHRERMTVMFTATWPESIRNLAAEFLHADFVRINVGAETLSANHRVTQEVEVVDQSQKESRLPQLLQKYHASRSNRVLVFALYKNEAARVEQTLIRKGYKCIAIHGDMSQPARTQALEQFKDGSCPLMVATDVAARGLDIPDVEVVINYTFPLTIEDYIHRIGRTGRGGKTGVSHTLFTSFDKAHAGALQNVLREAKQKVPEDLLKFGSSVKKKEHKMYGSFAGDSEKPMKAATKIVFDD
mmetsp:Transcript_28967/g.72243  ORF Transcript_28967/g.72243 Transcript_28967/m.72243 type:complete len:555 (+) Transcript_28967:89-1753(+)